MGTTYTGFLQQQVRDQMDVQKPIFWQAPSQTCFYMDFSQKEEIDTTELNALFPDTILMCLTQGYSSTRNPMMAVTIIANYFHPQP